MAKQANNHTTKGSGASAGEEYTSKSIMVLKGLEPIRRRPGMYIGGTSSTGLHHLVWELLDNAIDEALNQHCDRIGVSIRADGSISVEDNGRGIPTDRHPTTRKNTIETIFCYLHSGGKFVADAYKVAGGLHGVGAAVVNALSEEVTVDVTRDGWLWRQRFSRGKAASNLEQVAKSKGHGTKVTFRPDPKIFPKTKFDPDLIRTRVESKAFINKGLTIEVWEEQADARITYYYKNGLKDYLAKLLQGRETVSETPFYVELDAEIKLEAALQWTTGTDYQTHSFANSIYTARGGTHEQGLRIGIARAVRDFMTRRGLIPRGASIIAEDCREGLIAVLSVYIRGDVEFQGQVKDRLNSDITSQVDTLVKNSVENYLHTNPSVGEAVAGRVLLASQARTASRAAREAVKRKGPTTRLTLPGKLSDCSSRDMEACELFIVEGDSAGGNSKQARDRTIQAILPLRGKILNVEQATTERILKNEEIKNLITTIGTGIGPSYDYAKLRYGKIIIMTDADVDGYHISTLLLTFFYRYLNELIHKGHVYLAVPPLYRIKLKGRAAKAKGHGGKGKSGKGKERGVLYVLTEEEKEEILKANDGRVADIQRYKGLGEMNPGILKETTMDVTSRTLLKVMVEDRSDTDKTFADLLGREVAPRFRFIKERASFVKEILDV